MISAARRWLGNIPASDPFERRTATAVQLFCLGLSAWLVLGIVLSLVRSGLAGAASLLPFVLTDIFSIAFSLGAVMLIRRGRARSGYALVIAGYLAILGLSLVVRGLDYHRFFLVRVFAVLLVLPALLLGRRALWSALGFMLVAMLAGEMRDLGYFGGLGPQAPSNPPAGVWGQAIAVMVLLSVVLDRFGAALAEAYASAVRRRREAESISAELREAKESLEQEMERRRTAETMLFQSQKLEAIGRLSGGVAHDFNNLLTAILGFADLAHASSAAGDPNRGYLEGIILAARRGAGLTRQMLAFARRQVVQPTAVYVEEQVRAIEPILRRLVGENVSIDLALATEPVAVMIDPVQLEQVLVNLAVNARDAMPRGGRVRIETGRMFVAPGSSLVTAGLDPGKHARLLVSDDGEGMNAETLASVFEPFYTTKAVGKGTGLGLATCYGIVRQAGGTILPTSTPGQGATFEILLPETGYVPDVLPAETSVPATGGSETVLVVEDDPQVLELVVRVLRAHGYTTLTATTPAEAEAFMRARAGSLDLLITDVVLAGADGHRLGDALRRISPDLATLYMSGHSDEVIDRHGALAPGIELLPKPFTPAELLEKARRVLDAHQARA